MPISGAKMARFAGVGMEFVSPIIAGSLLGHFLDMRYHTDPWITLFLFLTGLGLGFYRLIREMQIAQRVLK